MSRTESKDLSSFGSAVELFAAFRGETPVGSSLLAATKARTQRHDLAPQVVDLAWELVEMAPELGASGREALLLLTISALINLRRGSTRLPVSGELGGACLREILATLTGSEEHLRKVLKEIQILLDSAAASAVIGDSERSYTPLIRDGSYVYLQRHLRQELRFVDALATRLKSMDFRRPKDTEIGAALDEVLARPSIFEGQPVVLSDEQRQAVLKSALLPFTVISGGPGTGKTSIIVVLLRVLARLGHDIQSIALAAPTGKAANRMAAAIRKGLEAIRAPDNHDEALLEHGPKPETLHRLLGYSPGTDRFRHHENNRLSEQVVIIDESSMIDLMLMERLIRSVRNDARLILLGDAEQLPSVDAGAVLRDIWAAESGEGESTIQLLHNFRMDEQDPAGRNILTVAQGINRGVLSQELVERDAVGDLSFVGVETLRANGSRRKELVDRWYEERVRAISDFEPLTRKPYRFANGRFHDGDIKSLERLFHHFEGFKILCLTRSVGFETSARAMNSVIHEKYVRDAGFEVDRDFCPGEPVVMQRNDYDRHLFNGDQGIVLNVRTEGDPVAPMAVFKTDAGFEAFQLPPMRHELELGHAMTVHRAQGSEFECVLLLLPEVDLALLTREILYTAVTRSRKSVVVVGNRELLESGVKRKVQRFSGVAEKLQKLREAD